VLALTWSFSGRNPLGVVDVSYLERRRLVFRWVTQRKSFDEMSGFHKKLALAGYFLVREGGQKSEPAGSAEGAILSKSGFKKGYSHLSFNLFFVE